MDAEGRIGTTVAVIAASEEKALQQVRGLAMIYAIELWDGGRLIASLPLQPRR